MRVTRVRGEATMSEGSRTYEFCDQARSGEKKGSDDGEESKKGAWPGEQSDGGEEKEKSGE